jgi:hypothetical protein
MPLPIKPTSKTLWTETNPTARAEPTGAEKETGWSLSQRPPFQFLNWLFWNLGLWVEYFEGITDLLSTAAGQAVSAVGHYIAVGADVQAQLDQLDFAVTRLGFSPESLGAGNGVKTDFPLASSPNLQANVVPFVDGMPYEQDEFLLVDVAGVKTIRFAGPLIPAVGQNVFALILGGTGVVAPGSKGGAWANYGSDAAPITVAALIGVLLGPDARQMRFTKSAGGAVPITSNPQVAPGSAVGQELLLLGTSDINYITLADGTGLNLSGPMSLQSGSALGLVWRGTAWFETLRR